MYKDEIIAEVWRNRDSYAQNHNFNLDAMVADLQKRERSHPERIVNRSGCRSGWEPPFRGAPPHTTNRTDRVISGSAAY